MPDRVATGVAAAAAALLFVRLAGFGAGWLPSPPALMAALVAVLGVRAAIRWRGGHPGERLDWRGLGRRHGFAIGLGALVLLALFVRLPGLGRDLGHVPLDIDEHRLAANVKHYFVTGELDHTTVEHYPGVVFWMMVGPSLVAFLVSLMQGTILEVRQMPVETFVLAGRMSAVVTGAATVVMTGMMGRQLAGPGVGLAGALLMALVPVSVQTTTVVRNDPGQVVFLVAAMYASLVAFESERRGAAVAAGILGGAATGIKYTSAFILVPALMAVLWHGTMARRATRAGVVLLAFVLTVAVTNHFLWYDFPNFVRQLSDQVGITGPGHWGAVENPAAFHTGILDRFGPGWPLLVLAAGFGVWGLVSGSGAAWVFWSFPLIYSWFTTQRPSQFPRWVYPLVPFVAVAGAAGLALTVAQVDRWRGWQRPRMAPRIRRAAVALLVLAALAPPLWSGLVLASRRFPAPTHELTEAWLRQHATGTVLLERGWLDLEGSRLTVRRVPDLGVALQSGLYALCVNDFIVVPETHFRNPALAQLTFVHRVVADQRTFGGNLGYDYAIYATPTLARFPGGDVRLDDPAATRILGPGWRADGSAEPGLPLPRAGASLFLPPLSQATTAIEFDVTGEISDAESPLSVSVGDTPLELSRAPAQAGIQRVAGVLTLDDPTRVTELRLSPAPSARDLRIVRVRFGPAPS